MKMYGAMIIGFKKSKNKMGHYHPIFKYEDEYGSSRTYIRTKSMEMTPFTMDKKYIICKKELDTFEIAERQLSPRVYFLALRILFLIIAFINPKIAALTVVANFAIRFGYEIVKITRRYELKKERYFMTCVGGRIVGYRNVKTKNPFNDGQPKYRPMVEYTYKGESFVHIGDMKCNESQKAVGALCKIYIDPKKKIIVDEFEIGAPIIAIPSLSTAAIQKTYERIVARTKRVKAREDKGEKQNDSVKPEDIGLSPLWTLDYKRAVGW